MPRKRIPEDELLRRQPQLQQCAPDNSCRRLRKTLTAFLRFACAARCDAGKDLRRLNPVVFLFSEQDSFGGHGNSTEMTAAVAKCFSNHSKSRSFKSFAEV